MSPWVFRNHLFTECMPQIILFLKLLRIRDTINKMQVTKLSGIETLNEVFSFLLDHMDEEEWTRPILSSAPKQNTQQGNHAYHGLVFECIKYVFLLHFVNLSFVQEVPCIILICIY